MACKVPILLSSVVKDRSLIQTRYLCAHVSGYSLNYHQTFLLVSFFSVVRAAPWRKAGAHPIRPIHQPGATGADSPTLNVVERGSDRLDDAATGMMHVALS